MITTGSGCACFFAGIIATASVIFRPAGASWFSGTSNFAHSASTARPNSPPSAQGLNTTLP
jgi:hypothetical protein